MFIRRALCREKMFNLNSYKNFSRLFSSETSSGIGTVKLSFGSPGVSLFVNEEVSGVTVPGMEGDFEIVGKHIPTLAVLRPGVVKVATTQGRTQSYFVSSGTVTVNADGSVQVSVEELCEKKDIDISKVQNALASYLKMINEGDEQKKAKSLIGQEVYRAMLAFAEEK
ncbi:ATP synthase subunit delta, mitochondrial-like [Zophobas morio]|uniref:ATP synthase subunit delta, mitochondrial-like n=1 Tax=Zophobas morio TaxID=2755281 RepID=UPI003083810E